MRKFMLAAAAIALSACLEPQPAPELDQRLSSDFNIETIAQGLKAAWSVSEITQGHYLVSERGGKLFQISNGVKTEITDLPEDIFVKGQGGLLEVAISPDFVKSDVVYISYAYGNSEANGTALMRAKLRGDKLENIAVIFRASPPKAAASHFGGKVVFLPDNTLLLTLGEGFAYREAAQDLGSHLGKIVRLTRDGGVPDDNPFIGVDGAKPQIYSYGHRNVQGIAYDPKHRAFGSMNTGRAAVMN